MQYNAGVGFNQRLQVGDGLRTIRASLALKNIDIYHILLGSGRQHMRTCQQNG